jgi:hypothetical protein
MMILARSVQWFPEWLVCPLERLAGYPASYIHRHTDWHWLCAGNRVVSIKSASEFCVINLGHRRRGRKRHLLLTEYWAFILEICREPFRDISACFGTRSATTEVRFPISGVEDSTSPRLPELSMLWGLHNPLYRECLEGYWRSRVNLATHFQPLSKLIVEIRRRPV